jgi:hypothetical protein
MSGLPLTGGAGEKKWAITDGIAEIKRELAMRERVYPQLIGRGTLDTHSAAKQNRDLTGTLRFLEFCAKNELKLRSLLEAA